MLISKYGVNVIVKYVAISTLIISTTLVYSPFAILNSVIIVLAAIFLIFLSIFFRDPHRNIPSGDNLIVSPADGKIILIAALHETEYLKDDAIQISIFMSPLNVHVNRIPISGIVSYFKYISGKYLVAFNDKASELNERTLIGIENKGNKVLFKQIAGAVARRIVAKITIGQNVVMGERFGMIKFGSRVDIIMPKHADIKIKLNHHVIAGETILATI